MSSLRIEKLNESFLRITCPTDQGIEYDLYDRFTFFVPGAKFTPAYKNKVWDGRIKLYSLNNKTLYAGLLSNVEQFAKDRSLNIEYINFTKQLNDSITPEVIKDFVDSLQLSSKGNQLEIRDYQYYAVWHALYNERALLLSPTSSGKSSIIYTIMRWQLNHNRRIMVIVPTTNLVEQLYSDFQDYSSLNGFNVSDHCQKLYSGFSKEFSQDVLITTFQSIMRWTQADFNKLDIGCVIVDECHMAKAKSITGILEKLVNTPYRIGLTGTLDGSKTNELVIQGLTGPVHKVTTTKKLMDDGHVTELKIKCVIIKYPDEYKKAAKNLKYNDEINFLVSYPKRNKIICDLALFCSGNTLILFQLVEKHGKPLYEQLIERTTNRNVYFISGDVSPVERESIRHLVEKDQNAIIVGSYQTISTGVNIPSIENVIFASPSKSRIRNLQSIGRGLRLKEGKSYCNLFDIADDLSYKKHINYTLKHFTERVKIYSEERFSFKIFDYQLLT